MKNQLTFDEKYQAVQNRDISYEGIFITAVKTTGIETAIPASIQNITLEIEIPISFYPNT